MAIEDMNFPEDTELAHLAKLSKAVTELNLRLEAMHIQTPYDQIEHISGSMNEINRHLTNLVAGNPLTNKTPFDKVIRAIYTVTGINIALVVLVLFLFF